jgi:4-hydroxybenzoate polyprenyltransferase
MPAGFSLRLLSLLQFTRMALVFTAIADGFCALLLLARSRLEPGETIIGYLGWGRIIAAATVSTALYGFGMSLNDIIDRRRDQQLAADRPLPSGRIGVATAHVICAALAFCALLAGLLLATYQSGEARTITIALLVWTGMLITFYDFAGKYLVAPGLLTLGLIRFFHATIPAPQLPLVWHPLLLLNHVTILSTICYHLEQKRPTLTRIHWWAVLGGLALVDAMVIGFVWSRRGQLAPEAFLSSLWIHSGLWLPAIAALVFVILCFAIRRSISDARTAGQTMMLYGLLWLIVYDASFVAGYVGWLQALVLLMLLPAAYFSVQLMRAWSRILLLSQKPTYQRAR